MQRVDGLGPAKFQVSPAGVKIDYIKAKYCIICIPPDWNVTWYSSANKIKFSESIKEFRLQKQLSPRNIPLTPPKLNTKYVGVNAIKVSRKISQDPSDQGFFRLSTEAARPIASDYYFSEPVKLPPEAHSFISTFFGTPNFGCMPLGFDIRESGGTTRKVYYTTKVTKAQIARSEFEIPQNYKTVSSPAKVTSGAGYGKDLDNLMEDMRLGEEFGTK